MKHSERAPGPRILLPRDPTSADALTTAPLRSPDLAAVKQAIRLVRQHKFNEVTTLAASINDPVARKLVEWAYLHDPESPADFDRYNAFLQGNAAWSSLQLRRRAEARLWQEGRNASTVRRFVGEQPASVLGRLAVARILLAEGDRAGASRQVRAVWQSSELSAELEAAIVNTFPGALTTDDDVARMDRRIGAKDFGAAMRVAKRLGSAQMAIVKACEAAEANSSKSAALLAAVPIEARADLGYALCRLPGCWHTMISQQRSSWWPNLRAMICGVRTPMNGGVSVAYLRAGSLISVTRRPPTALSRKRRLQPILIIAQNFTSCRAGSRCVSCRIRSRRFSISGKSTKPQVTQLC